MKVRAARLFVALLVAGLAACDRAPDPPKAAPAPSVIPPLAAPPTAEPVAEALPSAPPAPSPPTLAPGTWTGVAVRPSVPVYAAPSANYAPAAAPDFLLSGPVEVVVLELAPGNSWVDIGSRRYAAA